MLFIILYFSGAQDEIQTLKLHASTISFPRSDMSLSLSRRPLPSVPPSAKDNDTYDYVTMSSLSPLPHHSCQPTPSPSSTCEIYQNSSCLPLSSLKNSSSLPHHSRQETPSPSSPQITVYENASSLRSSSPNPKSSSLPRHSCQNTPSPSSPQITVYENASSLRSSSPNPKSSSLPRHSCQNTPSPSSPQITVYENASSLRSSSPNPKSSSLPCHSLQHTPSPSSPQIKCDVYENSPLLPSKGSPLPQQTSSLSFSSSHTRQETYKDTRSHSPIFTTLAAALPYPPRNVTEVKGPYTIKNLYENIFTFVPL